MIEKRKYDHEKAIKYRRRFDLFIKCIAIIAWAYFSYLGYIKINERLGREFFISMMKNFGFWCSIINVAFLITFTRHMTLIIRPSRKKNVLYFLYMTSIIFLGIGVIGAKGYYTAIFLFYTYLYLIALTVKSSIFRIRHQL